MKRLTISLILTTGTLLPAQQPGEDEHPLAGKRQALITATNGDAAAPTPEPTDGQPPEAPATPPTGEPVTPPPAVAEGDAIPQAYRADRYQATWDKNPFLIKVAATQQAVASFAEDWELKYLSERNGSVKAGIQNRKTQEYRNISTEPDSEGFQLVTAKISRNRKDSEAEISKGAEKATFKYNDTAPPPNAMARPGMVPGQTGAPGNQRPGAPAQNGYRSNGAVQQGAASPAGMPPRGAAPQAPPGMVPPGGVPAPNAPPSAINRRRVLIPAPVSPTAPNP